MHILMINYEFPPLGGGGSSVSYDLAKELAQFGYGIDVVTMGYKDLKRGEFVDGINIYRICCIRRRKEICHTYEMLSFIVLAIPVILKLIKTKKYALNHTHFIFPTGVLSLIVKKLTGLKYFVTAHGSDVPGHNPERFQLQHKLFLPLWKMVVRNAEKIVVPSGYLRDLILLHCKRGIRTKVVIIPHGFDFSKFDPVKKKQKRILLLSRIFKFKGFQYFLEAIKDLNIDYEINIVGDGPYKTELESLAERYHLRINFPSFLSHDDPRFKELYETSSIFVFPSESENFAIVLLEAMSAGMAIITTTVGGCREVVGDAAILVKPRDSVAIKKALLQLVNNPILQRELGLKARRRVEENFNWAKIANRHERLIHSLVSKEPISK